MRHPAQSKGNINKVLTASYENSVPFSSSQAVTLQVNASTIAAPEPLITKNPLKNEVALLMIFIG